MSCLQHARRFSARPRRGNPRWRSHWPGRSGAEILSVDSMQVYRGMDIGTAKPSPAERARVPHHLIDLVRPGRAFTVARFVEAADGVIADAAARGVPLIATGGTPLYYKALFEGLFEGPAADDAIRGRARRAARAKNLPAAWRQVDPAAAARIHANDTQAARARPGGLRADRQADLLIPNGMGGRPKPRAPRRLGRASIGTRTSLNRRINARVKAMLAAGWLAGGRRLLVRLTASFPRPPPRRPAIAN